MQNTWEILQKELAINKIKLIDDKHCQFSYKGKVYVTTIEKKIKLIDKKIKKNTSLFRDLWKELSELLSYPDCPYNTKKLFDIKIVNLFINSIKEIDTFARTLCTSSKKCNYLFIKLKFFQKMKVALNRDYIEFPSNVVLSVPDYKMSIDWVARQNSILNYQRSLLLFALRGHNNVSKCVIKMARGISGPWANLDLPKLERVFPWNDIEEEVRGREKDKEKQRRYRKGFENYNSPGVGEGYYWREIRNEPFSWYDRSTEDPYPSRYTLSRH